MTSSKERFWITFLLRFAFGFLFLFVAIGQFDAGGPRDHGPSFFAEKLSQPFASSWLGNVLPDVDVPERDEDGNVVQGPGGAPKIQATRDLSYYFLLALPYTFAALSVPILTGLFLRPALRLGALLLIVLGLGKYITGGNDIGPTVYNFALAALICVGLYFLSQEARPREEPV